MKGLKIGLMVVALLGMAILGTANAAIIVTATEGVGQYDYIDYITKTYWAGEFNMTVLSGPYADFISFCLERNEYLSNPMYVNSITETAILGGVLSVYPVCKRNVCAL
jgi:hypothetical protein